jgi:quinolinate synthase
MNSSKLIESINKLRKEKNAIILAHYYQEPDVQDIADFIGDSLQLSQKAKETNADIIVFAGVYFMAETAKILSPEKKVLIPDKEASCSLAESINAEQLLNFKKQYPDHIVVSYVNTTAEVKAVSDIICTSSNAEKIINSIPQDKKIIFTPDINLGKYLQRKTGREMVIWEGVCIVHEEFSLQKILDLKKENPDAKIISHPECKEPILLVSDFIGSTSALLNFVKTDDAKKYIVATETGILHQMKKAMPDKVFIPAPPEDSTCACNDCKYMKLTSLEKVYLSLKYEQFEVNLPEDIIKKAYIPIQRMLDLSR